MAVIRYHSPALEIPTPGIRRNVLFIQFYQRLPIGFNGKPPRYLIEWMRAEGGYCIDAPDEMPAGGCEGIWIPDINSGDDNAMMGAAAQLHFDRHPDPWGLNPPPLQDSKND